MRDCSAFLRFGGVKGNMIIGTVCVVRDKPFVLKTVPPSPEKFPSPVHVLSGLGILISRPALAFSTHCTSRP